MHYLFYADNFQDSLYITFRLSISDTISSPHTRIFLHIRISLTLASRHDVMFISFSRRGRCGY